MGSLVNAQLMSSKEADMQKIDRAGTFTLGGRIVKRFGYGAMQLAGPGVFGPPRDRDAAVAVLREAVALGINHIDTSDFYGPHITNQIIREALEPLSRRFGDRDEDRCVAGRGWLVDSGLWRG